MTSPLPVCNRSRKPSFPLHLYIHLCSENEFYGLFDRLDLRVSEIDQRRMFCYVDSDNSGYVSLEEWLESWDWLEQELHREVAEKLEIDDESIAMTLLSIAALLALLSVFLFVSIKAWSDVGTFSSAIQSGMIAIAGGAMSALKSVPTPDEMNQGGQRVKELLHQKLVSGEDDSDDEDGDV